MKAPSSGTWSKARPVRSVAVLSGGLLVAMVAAGCGSPTPTSTPSLTSIASRPPSSTPASASPTLSPEAADTWGPLAVIPAQDGADTARTEGTLRITNTCVFLADKVVDLSCSSGPRTALRGMPATGRSPLRTSMAPESPSKTPNQSPWAAAAAIARKVA